MKTRQVMGLALVAALAVLLAVVATKSGSVAAADGSPAISQQDAVARFTRVDPNGKNVHATLVKDTDGRHGRYKITSDTAVGTIDASDGHVASLVILGSVPTGNSVKVDQGLATRSGQSYLDQLGVSTSGFTAHAELIDHGSYKEWDVRWQRRVNGALTPETLEVSVDPDTGRVFSLVNVSTPFTTPPTPTVQSDAAVAAAQKHLGWKSASPVTADLVISFAPDGTQLLVWQVVLTTSQNGVPVYAREMVNALDGSVTDLGQG